METPFQENVSCPVCKSSAKPWTRANAFTLFSCPNCGLGFVFPLPTNYLEVYSGDYFQGATNGFGYVNYDADKQSMVPVFKEYLSQLKHHLPTQGRLLDVGAATGFFVRLALEANWQAEGIEVSPQAVELAIKQNLPVQVATLESLSQEKTYDVLTLWDVLEHLPDPANALRHAYQLLNETGLIAINIPDKGSWYARLMGPRWHAIIPPEHLYYFTKHSLSLALNQSGFQVLETSTINKSFSLSYIFSTASRWLHLAFLNNIANILEKTWINKLAIPLPLGDNLFIIAKKERTP